MQNHKKNWGQLKTRRPKKGEPMAVGLGTGVTMREVKRKLKEFAKRKKMKPGNYNWRAKLELEKRPAERVSAPMESGEEQEILKRLERQGHE